MSDRELIKETLDGNTDAICWFLSCRCGAGLAHLICGCGWISLEDFIHEVLLILYKNDWNALRNFKGTSTLKTYVHTCAANFLRGRRRSRLPEMEWSNAVAGSEGEPKEIEDPKWQGPQLRTSLIQAIMALESPQERIVILEYKIRGRSPEEVARMLSKEGGPSITPENVYTIFSRARKHLREELKKGGIYV